MVPTDMENRAEEIDEGIIRLDAARPLSNLSAQIDHKEINRGTGAANNAEFEKLPKIGHKARDAEVCHGPPF